LFAWKEELVRACVGKLTLVVLQVGSADQWIWHLHSSHCYFVSSAYNKLTDVDNNVHQNSYKFVWVKVVPLKVSIFTWRLFRNRVSTRGNLLHRHIRAANEQGCIANCGVHVDVNYLFVNCDFFGRIWYYISCWLGFSIAFNGRVLDHIYQFGSLRGFSHKVKCSLNVIWLSVAWVTWNITNIFFRGRRKLYMVFVKGWSFSHIGGLSRNMFYSILSTNYGGCILFIV